MTAPNLNVLEQVVNYIKCSDAIASRYQKEAATKQASDDKVRGMIPDVVEALVKNQRLPGHLREKAASLLADPAKALEILINTANHRNQAEAGQMGTPSGGTQKKAHVRGSLNSPYVGGRVTEERDSDRILFERLGLR